MTEANEEVFLPDEDNISFACGRSAMDFGAQVFMKSWQALLQRIASKSAVLADGGLQEPRR